MRTKGNRGGEESSGRDVVMIGVKPENESKELLIWVLINVAKPGDTVIALHVIGGKENMIHGGAASFFSLVKALDSVVAAYEGFCSLKQVDLKLKICRGSSVKEMLVREAKSNAVTKLVVGAGNQTHKNKLSTVVAKHCSKKLPKMCSVEAVSNGKSVFQRENCRKDTGDSGDSSVNRPNSLLNVLLRSATVGRHSDASISTQQRNDKNPSNLWLRRNKSFSLQKSAENDCSLDQPKDRSQEHGPCLVSTKKERSRSNLEQVKEIQDTKPGWPLLGNNVLSKSSRVSSKKISVVQWAMKLPTRQFSEINQTIGNEINHKLLTQVPEILLEQLEGFHYKGNPNCKLFSYEELATATSEFTKDNLTGQGGSSQVFRGSLTNGTKIAVKKLKRSDQSIDQFALEMEIITTLSHQNIVSLKGFGFDAKNLFFVYDLLSRGSLEDNLHRNSKKSISFGWDQRYHVALGVAEALNCLHSGSPKSVIHRDVKSSNILLSHDFKPQLADFGLATWAPSSSSYITCIDVSGTFGYLAPEYFMHGKVHYKTDVYAFGVVLLELLSGRKPISNDLPKGQESLVMWANPILNSRSFEKLLDPNLDSDYDHNRIESMVLAAILCTKRSPRARPQMNLIVRLLEGDCEATRWAKMQTSVATEESDSSDDEGFAAANLQSHLNLALLDVDEHSVSTSSGEQRVSLEDYLKGRWSRSSSFD